MREGSRSWGLPRRLQLFSLRARVSRLRVTLQLCASSFELISNFEFESESISTNY